MPATALGSAYTASWSYDPEGGAPHPSAKTDALGADPSEFGSMVLEPQG